MINQRFRQFVNRFKFYIIINVVILVFILSSVLKLSNHQKQFNLIKLNDIIINTYNPSVTLPLSLRFTEDDTINVKNMNNKDTYLGEYFQRAPEVNYQSTNLNSLSKSNLEKQYLRLNNKVKERIADNHKKIIHDISRNSKFSQSNFVSPYKGDGIVFVGGGDHSAMIYAIIKVIRTLTPNMPIEVLIPDMDIMESDQNFCRMIEDMNSKCIYLKDYFEQKFYNYKSYQFKSLALLLSSFENVLLLEADNYPLVNFENIF